MESMTGYAEGRFSHPSFELKISVRSLNNKYLDVIIKGGVYIRPLEDDIRTVVREFFKRGRIEVYMDIRFTSLEKQRILINKDVISEIIRELRPLSAMAPLSMDGILRIPGLVDLSFNEEGFSDDERKFIFSGLKEVLSTLKKTRIAEGERIKKYIKERLSIIKKERKKIEKIFSGEKERIRKDIENKIREMSVDVDEERIVQEAAIMAVRYDISEEISRIDFHVKQFEKSMEDGGKKLDFIAQEILREANTINSKTLNPEITRHAIVIKTTVEEIREQVHNLE